MLIWVDTNNEELHMLNIETGLWKEVTVNQRIGSVALCESGNRLLLALETTFAYYYFEKSKIEYLSSSYKQVVQGNKNCRLNDGRCDR